MERLSFMESTFRRLKLTDNDGAEVLNTFESTAFKDFFLNLKCLCTMYKHKYVCAVMGKVNRC